MVDWLNVEQAATRDFYMVDQRVAWKAVSLENQTVEMMVESLASEVVGRMDIVSVGKSVERMVGGVVVLTVIY